MVRGRVLRAGALCAALVRAVPVVGAPASQAAGAVFTGKEIAVLGELFTTDESFFGYATLCQPGRMERWSTCLVHSSRDVDSTVRAARTCQQEANSKYDGVPDLSSVLFILSCLNYSAIRPCFQQYLGNGKLRYDHHVI